MHPTRSLHRRALAVLTLGLIASLLSLGLASTSPASADPAGPADAIADITLVGDTNASMGLASTHDLHSTVLFYGNLTPEEAEELGIPVPDNWTTQNLTSLDLLGNDDLGGFSPADLDIDVEPVGGLSSSEVWWDPVADRAIVTGINIWTSNGDVQLTQLQPLRYRACAVGTQVCTGWASVSFRVTDSGPAPGSVAPEARLSGGNRIPPCASGRPTCQQAALDAVWSGAGGTVRFDLPALLWGDDGSVDPTARVAITSGNGGKWNPDASGVPSEGYWDEQRFALDSSGILTVKIPPDAPWTLYSNHDLLYSTPDQQGWCGESLPDEAWAPFLFPSITVTTSGGLATYAPRDIWEEMLDQCVPDGVDPTVARSDRVTARTGTAKTVRVLANDDWYGAPTLRLDRATIPDGVRAKVNGDSVVVTVPKQLAGREVSLRYRLFDDRRAEGAGVKTASAKVIVTTPPRIKTGAALDLPGSGVDVVTDSGGADPPLGLTLGGLGALLVALGGASTLAARRRSQA